MHWYTTIILFGLATKKTNPTIVAFRVFTILFYNARIYRNLLTPEKLDPNLLCAHGHKIFKYLQEKHVSLVDGCIKFRRLMLFAQKKAPAAKFRSVMPQKSEFLCNRNYAVCTMFNRSYALKEVNSLKKAWECNP